MLGCDPAEESELEQVQETTTLQELAVLHGAPERVFNEGRDTTRVVTEAVVRASLKLEQLTVTGTVTAREGGFAYEPQPRDRLVINRSPTEQVTAIITAIDPAPGDSAPVYVAGIHELGMRVIIDERIDADIISRRDDQGTVELYVGGQVWLSGTATTVDFDASGQYVSTIHPDDTFTVNESLQLGGSIEGDGFSIVVDESWAVQTRVDLEQRFEALERYMNDRAETAERATYTWANLSTYQALLDGVATDLDTWRASGAILRDGTEHASIALVARPDEIATVLVAGDETNDVGNARL